jgi:hypothetical protein
MRSKNVTLNVIIVMHYGIIAIISNTTGPCVDRVVGIATGYGLDGPGIESWWGRGFPHLSRPLLGPARPPVQWVPRLSRGKERRAGRDTGPSPTTSAVVIKE